MTLDLGQQAQAASSDPGPDYWALVELTFTKTPVRVQIDQTLIRFKAQLAVQPDGKVVIRKPFGLNGYLASGTCVRLRIPGAEKREVRLEVLVSDQIRSTGELEFVCKPLESLLQCRRTHDRFDTSEHAHLGVVIGGTRLQLFDISERGFRAGPASALSPETIMLGREIPEVRLELGWDAQIRFARVVPRNFREFAIGFEFVPETDRASERYLRHLLDTLRRSDRAHMNE
jgi:hypothetical protein